MGVVSAIVDKHIDLATEFGQTQEGSCDTNINSFIVPLSNIQTNK